MIYDIFRKKRNVLFIYEIRTLANLLDVPGIQTGSKIVPPSKQETHIIWVAQKKIQIV